jgi:hypothetical protein
VRRVAVAFGACALVIALAVSARATHSNLVDGNDVKGLLDVHTVVFRHDHGPYAWIFRTYAPWTVRGIWDRGYFVVELDTLGSAAIDYRILLRSDGRSIVGDLFRVQKDGDEVRRASVSGWRAGGRGAGVEVSRRALRYGPNRTSFFWSTASLFTGERCRAACIDRAPDDGAMVEQPLVEPSPTPSPTASVSPSVSPTP